jgi:hypothetical protein
MLRNTDNLEMKMTFPVKSKRTKSLKNKEWFEYEKLSIREIAEKLAEDGHDSSLIEIDLIEACKDNELIYIGDIKGWEWGGNELNFIKNPYPEILGHQVDKGEPLRTAIYNQWRAFARDCLIDRNDFKVYLKNTDRWLQEHLGKLTAWWTESELPPKTVDSLSTNTNTQTRPNGHRNNQLHNLIWEVYSSLTTKLNKKIQAQKVWNEIQNRSIDYDSEEIIQEVTANKINWSSVYKTEQCLKRSSFDGVLSRLKKKRALQKPPLKI